MRKLAFIFSLVLIFVIPWEGVIDIPGIGAAGSATLARVMGLGLAAFWLAMVVYTGNFRKPGLFHLIFLIFVLWNGLSVFWSANPKRSFSHTFTWIQLLLLSFILWDLFRTKKDLLAGLQVYVLGAYVAVGSAILNFFSGKQFYTHYDRYSAGDTNPDGFGFILALGIPLAWYLASTLDENKLSRLLKFVNYFYIPAALFGLALSGTRTALAASILGVLYGLVSLSRLRITTRIAIVFLLISVSLILLPNVQSLKSFQRFNTISAEITQGDLNSRTEIWQEGLDSFNEHPILGVGSNMYRSINSFGKVAHNSFISVLVELGLVGLVLFGIILAITFVQAWELPKWDSIFWLTVLLVWTIGASTLSWEYRKSTWLFLTFLVAFGSLSPQRDQVTSGNKVDITGAREQKGMIVKDSSW
jgi:O-antigen ligase